MIQFTIKYQPCIPCFMSNLDAPTIPKRKLFKSIERFQRSLREARSRKWILECVFAQAFAFGAKNICYAHAPPLGAEDFKRPNIIAHRGLPDGWPETYLESGYLENDPISRTALSQNFPFYWHDVYKLKTLSDSEQAYLDHIKREEIDCGICIPVFGPRGRNGFFGIGFGPSLPALSEDAILSAQQMCQLAHQFYCANLMSQMSKPLLLSAREAEVLRLVLFGHSGVEIASKLQISEHSVATYLRRANDKLDTDTRFAAATKAWVAGLLD